MLSCAQDDADCYMPDSASLSRARERHAQLAPGYGVVKSYMVAGGVSQTLDTGRKKPREMHAPSDVQRAGAEDYDDQQPITRKPEPLSGSFLSVFVCDRLIERGCSSCRKNYRPQYLCRHDLESLKATSS